MSYPVEDRSMLGPPPWKPDDPRLQGWEAAHGHDVRLDCDLHGCSVLIEAYEAAVEALERLLELNMGADNSSPQVRDARAALARLREKVPA